VTTPLTALISVSYTATLFGVADTVSWGVQFGVNIGTILGANLRVQFGVILGWDLGHFQARSGNGVICRQRPFTQTMSVREKGSKNTLGFWGPFWSRYGGHFGSSGGSVLGWAIWGPLTTQEWTSVLLN